MNDLRQKLSDTLQRTGKSRAKCFVESGVSIPTIQNFLAGKRINEDTQRKLTAWIEKQKGNAK